jgi:hypothetical protein
VSLVSEVLPVAALLAEWEAWCCSIRLPWTLLLPGWWRRAGCRARRRTMTWLTDRAGCRVGGRWLWLVWWPRMGSGCMGDCAELGDCVPIRLRWRSWWGTVTGERGFGVECIASLCRCRALACWLLIRLRRLMTWWGTC